jgi:hypothetical protein
MSSWFSLYLIPLRIGLNESIVKIKNKYIAYESMNNK